MVKLDAFQEPRGTVGTVIALVASCLRSLTAKAARSANGAMWFVYLGPEAASDQLLRWIGKLGGEKLMRGAAQRVARRGLAGVAKAPKARAPII